MEKAWMEHKKMIQQQSLHLRSRADTELNLDLPNSWPYLRQVLERPLYSNNFLVSSISRHFYAIDPTLRLSSTLSYIDYFKILLFVCLLIFPQPHGPFKLPQEYNVSTSSVKPSISFSERYFKLAGLEAAIERTCASNTEEMGPSERCSMLASRYVYFLVCLDCIGLFYASQPILNLYQHHHVFGICIHSI